MNQWLAANTVLIESTVWWLGEWSLRAAVLLALAWGITLWLRRAGAALRHVVWLSALLGIAALPALHGLLPAWDILPRKAFDNHATPGVTPSAEFTMFSPAALESASAPSVSSSSTSNLPQIVESTAPPVSKRTMIFAAVLLLWAGLALWLGARLFFAVGRLKRLEGRAAEANGAPNELLRGLVRESGVFQSPRLLISDAEVMPMTWGWLAPRILLPISAQQWSAREMTTVLNHELGHIRRGDWITKILTELIGCAAWFHPLVWLARANLVVEQEKACDEWVVQKGNSAADYAETLVALATRFSRAQTSCVGAALGWSGKLESRVSSILESSAQSRKVSVQKLVISVALVVALMLPITAATSAPKENSVAAEKVGSQEISADPGLPLVGEWIGVSDSEGIWQFTRSGKYSATFNGVKNDHAGTWKLEENRLVLSDGSDRTVEILGGGSLVWAHSKEGTTRKESFRKKVELARRKLEKQEQELAGIWTGMAGMIQATLTFESDGTFATGSVLKGPPIAEGTWRLNNAALEMVTISDHDPERIGRTNRFAILEINERNLLLFDRQARRERGYTRTNPDFAQSTGKEGTGEVRGTVKQGNQPLARVQVLFERYEPKDEFRYDKEIMTAADGSFSATDLPPGKYRVSRLFTWESKTEHGSTITGTGTHSTLVEVYPGLVTHTQIGGSGRSIKGKLAASGDLPKVAYTSGDIRFLTVNEPVGSFGGRHIVLKINEDGTFTADDVPPGEYKLYVRAKASEGPLDGPDIATFSKLVEVPVGEDIFDLGVIPND